MIFFINVTLFPDVTFECLGSWSVSGSKTASSDRYVAFLDSRGSTSFLGPAKRRRPRYRCGVSFFFVYSEIKKKNFLITSFFNTMILLFYSFIT